MLDRLYKDSNRRVRWWFVCFFIITAFSVCFAYIEGLIHFYDIVDLVCSVVLILLMGFVVSAFVTIIDTKDTLTRDELNYLNSCLENNYNYSGSFQVFEKGDKHYIFIDGRVKEVDFIEGVKDGSVIIRKISYEVDEWGVVNIVEKYNLSK